MFHKITSIASCKYEVSKMNTCKYILRYFNPSNQLNHHLSANIYPSGAESSFHELRDVRECWTATLCLQLDYCSSTKYLVHTLGCSIR